MVIYLGHKLCNFSSLKYSSRRSWTDVDCEVAYNSVIVNHWTYILPNEVVHLLVLRYKTVSVLLWVEDTMSHSVHFTKINKIKFHIVCLYAFNKMCYLTLYTPYTVKM